MIDHLFNATTETGLINSIGSYNPDGNGPLYTAGTGWRGDIAFPCVMSDYTIPSSPVAVGFSVWVGLPKVDNTLSSNSNCVLMADRELASAGNPGYLLKSSLTPEQRAVRKISPVIMGAYYPFMTAPLPAPPEVTPPNPSLNNVNPSSAKKTVGIMTFNVNGARFYPGSMVSFGGAFIPAVFKDTSQLTATIDTNSYVIGSYLVYVDNQAGGQSISKTFTIT